MKCHGAQNKQGHFNMIHAEDAVSLCACAQLKFYFKPVNLWVGRARETTDQVEVA